MFTLLRAYFTRIGSSDCDMMIMWKLRSPDCRSLLLDRSSDRLQLRSESSVSTLCSCESFTCREDSLLLV